MKDMSYRIATVFGLGDLLPAPGTTAGSFPTALLFFAVALGLGRSPLLGIFLLCALIASTIAGIWAAEKERLRRGKEDPGPVVIDEVAGQCVAYLCGFFVVSAFNSPSELLLFTAAGFFLFRFFDILKPWPVRQLEQLEGGFGIMADDLVAGLQAGLVLALGWPWLRGVFESFLN